MGDYYPPPYGPGDQAPKVTNFVNHCKLCGHQWAVRAEGSRGKESCPFCGAPSNAVRVRYEGPRRGYSGPPVR